MSLLSEIKNCEDFKKVSESFHYYIKAVGLSFWGSRYVIYKEEKVEIDLIIHTLMQRGFELYNADKLGTIENRRNGELSIARIKAYKGACEKVFPGNWFTRLLKWLREKGFLAQPIKPIYPAPSPFRLFKDTDWSICPTSTNYRLIDAGRYYDELFQDVNPISAEPSHG